MTIPGLELLIKAINRLALVMEKRLAFDQEQVALKERRRERKR